MKQQNLEGFYKVKSPYHKTEKYLPFHIVYDRGEKLYCETIEYKGRAINKVEDYWTRESIEKMIINKVLLTAKLEF